MPAVRLAGALLALSWAGAALAQNTAPVRDLGPVKAGAQELVVTTIARGLSHPWSVAFLPDGAMLVTERPGRLRIVAQDGKLSSPVSGLPPVHARGQGGLLDVVTGPDFASSKRIFFSYAEPRGEGLSGTAVASAVLDVAAGSLTDVKTLFRQEPGYRGNNHWGSRLVFAPDGRLFVTLGERFDLREKAQDLSTLLGKVVRIAPDGTVPSDNPFAGRAGARPEIWSYGHRNVQAAAINPATGMLWTVEHGAMGGDEINIPQAGRNYGWPVISYGVNYDGSKIGEGTAKAGMEQPIFYWDPSIAPSGMVFYTGDAIPGWKGSLFVGALKDKSLVRLTLAGDKVAGEERLLKSLNARIRDVRQGPDGALYLLTDAEDGRLLRVGPTR